MSIEKLTIITASASTIKQEVEGYYNLDKIHSSQQLITLLLTLNNPKKEHITIKTSNDCIIAHINNIILSTEFNIEVPIYRGVKLKRDQVELLDLDNKPCEFGEYGFEVLWINNMLDELFDVTVSIQENMPI